MKKLMLSIFALAAFGFSANAEVISADGHVLLVAPATVERGTLLEFGKIAIGTLAGTITMTPDADGVITTGKTGDASPITSALIPAAAAFAVKGEHGQPYTITKPADIFLKLGGVASPVSIAFNTPVLTLALDETTGEGIFYIGGTLDIPAATEVGDYTGSFDVTVTFN